MAVVTAAACDPNVGQAPDAPLLVDPASGPAPRASGPFGRACVSVLVSVALHAQAALALHLAGVLTDPRALPVAAGPASIELRASLPTEAGGAAAEMEEVELEEIVVASPAATGAVRFARQADPPAPDAAAPPILRREASAAAPEPSVVAQWAIQDEPAVPDVAISPTQNLPVRETLLPTVGLRARPPGRDGTVAGPGAADADRAGSPGSRESQGALEDGPPVAAYNPAPTYPPDLLAARIAGRVVLRVRVGVDGRVREAGVLRSSGYAALDDSALAAVREWRFVPAQAAGRRVEAEVAVPVRFVIAHGAQR